MRPDFTLIIQSTIYVLNPLLCQQPQAEEMLYITAANLPLKTDQTRHRVLNGHDFPLIMHKLHDTRVCSCRLFKPLICRLVYPAFVL